MSEYLRGIEPLPEPLRLVAMADREPPPRVQQELQAAIYDKAAEIRSQRVQHGNIIGGRDCLPPATYRLIEKLLAEGWSDRRVAKAAQVGRRTVSKFKTRGAPLSPYRRCSTCAGKVLLPCRACTLRRRLVNDRSVASDTRPSDFASAAIAQPNRFDSAMC
jgi:hypothetical protein